MTIREEARSLVAKMTLKEKCMLYSGKDFWNLNGVARLGLPDIMVTDGPHGLRKQAGASDHLGINQSVPATSFPTASATACSFDEELLFEMGAALGEECRKEDVAVILGPGANIKRSPLCGRNFEYFSEDPYLSGKIAAAHIRGVQSKGVGASLKHFAANNQEKGRMVMDSVVDARALMETELRSFEIAAREGKPWTVMCSYNRINGTYAPENHWLLTETLRDDWGYEGMVMTDWGAMNNAQQDIKAGLDLVMPSSGTENAEVLMTAIDAGELSAKVVDEMATRVTELILKYKIGKDIPYTCDMDAHLQLARRIASESAVLLKNEDGILPGKAGQTVAVVGAFAEKARYQGAGSSKINPIRIDSALEAFKARGIDVDYAPGYEQETGKTDENMLEKAAICAAGKDIVYLFIGLPDAYESEGFDRTDIALPESHVRLVDELSKVNPNLVVILSGGSAMDVRWRDKAKGILLMYLAGCQGGKACVDLLLGDANPCGKLAETFPETLDDTPARHYFPGGKDTVEYRESVYIGYRYYDKAGVKPAYPFGHGLSYAKFEYGDFSVSEKGASVTVTNTGDVFGKEIVQLYICPPEDSVLYRPVMELRGFAKVALAPGESKTATFAFDARTFAYYNVTTSAWQVEGGEYGVCVAASSRDIRARGSVSISGDGAPVPDYRASAPEYYKPSHPFKVSDDSFTAALGHAIPPREKPVFPITTDTRLDDIGGSFIGRMIQKTVYEKAGAMMGGEESFARMMREMMRDLPLRFMVMGSAGKLSMRKCEGLALMMSGKWVQGIRKLLK